MNPAVKINTALEHLKIKFSTWVILGDMRVINSVVVSDISVALYADHFCSSVANPVFFWYKMCFHH